MVRPQITTNGASLIVPYLATLGDKTLLRGDDSGAKHSRRNTTNPPVQEQNHLYKEAERLEASYLTLSNKILRTTMEKYETNFKSRIEFNPLFLALGLHAI